MPRSDWVNPAHFKRCNGKPSFRSLARAEIEVERASRKTREFILAYTCFDCGWVSRPPRRSIQRVARIAHIDRPCQQCGGMIPGSSDLLLRRTRLALIKL